MATLQTCVIIFMLFMFFKFSVKLPIIGSLDTPTALSTAFVVFHLVPWLLSLAQTYRQQPGPRRFSDPVTCLKILKNQPYDDMLGTNKLSPETSRAIPNQRLVRAFHIDNGFTTNDHAYGRQFNGDAVQRLRGIASRGWRDIGEETYDIASTYFSKWEQDKSAPFEIVIQMMTMKVILLLFWGVTAPSDHAPHGITQEINDRWIQSKSPTESMRIDFSYLKGEFKDLGLDWSDSKGNPMNVLLPAYETLWRVVAHCLIEVAFRPSADVEWLRVLETFRKNPTTGFL
ncbi:MAG: hypothetical protein Q9204_005041 [Flavoplaca sp. TL-2023a]